MTKRRITAVVMVLGAWALSACGSSSAAPATGGNGGGTPATVAPAATSHGGNGY
jgi:hypothetical protein